MPSSDTHLTESESALAWLRDRARAGTAQRALEAGQYLLDTRGWGALSTSAIARHVGVSQPTLYAHFPNLGAYLERLVAEVMAPAQGWVLEFHASLLAVPSDSYGDLCGHYARVLDLVDARGRFMRQFMTYRRHASSLGIEMRAFEARVHAEVEAQALDTIASQGFDPDLLAPQAALFASSLTSVVFALLERHLDADVSRPMCAKILASQQLALSAHVFRGRIIASGPG